MKMDARFYIQAHLEDYLFCYRRKIDVTLNLDYFWALTGVLQLTAATHTELLPGQP